MNLRDITFKTLSGAEVRLTVWLPLELEVKVGLQPSNGGRLFQLQHQKGTLCYQEVL